MKVKLFLSRNRRRHHRDNDCHLPWKRALPFHVNPRGILIHRVRDATTMWYRDTLGFGPHEAFGYYCGGQANGSGKDLTDNPPAIRLLCERCEAAAIAAGQISADELAGRHVHVGRVKPFRTCCRDKEQ